MACFDSAVATVAMGRARTSAVVTPFDKRVTAWHEAGHALTALLLEDADDPVQVSIVPRGPAGGVTWMSGNDDIFLSRKKALSSLIVAFGGRVGEMLCLDGQYTQGASSDLQAATSLASQMTMQYGMTRLGFMTRQSFTTSTDKVIEELLQEAYQKATTLLTKHQGKAALLAEALLENGDLNLQEIKKIVSFTTPDLDDYVYSFWLAEKVILPEHNFSDGILQPSNAAQEVDKSTVNIPEAVGCSASCLNSSVKN